MKRHRSSLSVATLGFVLAFACTLAANGEEFFAAAKNGKVDLVYFGRIKDRRSGRSVADSVYFLLKDKSTGLSFPFTNDRPGHYRSPDVGAAIKDIGEQVDTGAFEIEINVAGYRKLTVARMPRKAHGAVELDLSLEPVVSDAVATAGLSSSDGSSYVGILGLLIGSLVLFFIGRGVRTSGRRQTTRH